MRVGRFTFIEVLVAAAILAMAVGMTLGIMGTARARILRAERRWGRAHHLSNVTEFYLLAGPDGAMPASLLPQGFSAHCELREVEELPEHAAESLHGWQDWILGEYHIFVFGPRGGQLGEWVVEKVVREDDCY